MKRCREDGPLGKHGGGGAPHKKRRSARDDASLGRLMTFFLIAILINAGLMTSSSYMLLLRRSRIVNEHRLEIGNTVLDYDSLTVTSDEGVAELPKKEFMLLFKLLSYQNKIFTRRQLMDEIWDMDSESDERTVDVHINRLRDRFRRNNDFEIVTVRGLGYKAVKRG